MRIRNEKFKKIPSFIRTTMLASLLRRSLVTVTSPAVSSSASAAAAAAARGVRIVTLSSPETLNAMTPAMGKRFKETIRELGQEKDLRAVVLQGEGKV